MRVEAYSFLPLRDVLVGKVHNVLDHRINSKYPILDFPRIFSFVPCHPALFNGSLATLLTNHPTSPHIIVTADFRIQSESKTTVGNLKQEWVLHRILDVCKALRRSGRKTLGKPLPVFREVGSTGIIGKPSLVNLACLYQPSGWSSRGCLEAADTRKTLCLSLAKDQDNGFWFSSTFQLLYIWL